jgi:hypothetical protein
MKVRQMDHQVIKPAAAVKLAKYPKTVPAVDCWKEGKM